MAGIVADSDWGDDQRPRICAFLAANSSSVRMPLA